MSASAYAKREYMKQFMFSLKWQRWFSTIKLFNFFNLVLTANAPVATVLGSIPASVGTVESEGRQMKQCWILYEQKKKKNSPKKYLKKKKSISSYSPLMYARKICVCCFIYHNGFLYIKAWSTMSGRITFSINIF